MAFVKYSSVVRDGNLTCGWKTTTLTYPSLIHSEAVTETVVLDALLIHCTFVDA